MAPLGLFLGEQNEPLSKRCLSQTIYQTCSNFQPFLLPTRSLSGIGKPGLESTRDALSPSPCSQSLLPAGSAGSGANQGWMHQVMVACGCSYLLSFTSQQHLQLCLLVQKRGSWLPSGPFHSGETTACRSFPQNQQVPSYVLTPLSCCYNIHLGQCYPTRQGECWRHAAAAKQCPRGPETLNPAKPRKTGSEITTPQPWQREAELQCCSDPRFSPFAHSQPFSLHSNSVTPTHIILF